MSSEISDRTLPDWAAGLAIFLKRNTSVEALRVDPLQRTVEIATLGEVDLALLQTRLTETIRQIEDGKAMAPVSGISIKPGDTGTFSLEKETCLTAPMLWRWREMEWPEDPHEEKPTDEWRFLVSLAVICGGLATMGFALSFVEAVPAWVSIVFYVGAMIAGGWEAFIDTKEGLPKGELDIHFLMLAVAVGAASIGAWAEGALLLFLFSFSGALEHFALDRTRREINSLFDTIPDTATVVTGGEEEEVPVEQVAIGDLVRVRPGALFPVDAEVISGKSAADESNLTGEANPVSKMVGDTVLSGTMNLWGSVETRVLRLAEESSLQRVIHLIREAQHLKAPSQRFTDKFGTGYTIGILGLITVMFFIWWLGFGILPFTNSEAGFSAFYRAMTLLVVASPCALVLSIPSAILAAIAWGARRGVLFRGGAAIEKLAEVDLVALDKTGTLTTGEMEVAAVESFPPGREREAAELAYSLEAHGSHPIGRAIKKYGRTQGLELREIDDFKAMSGKGIQGRESGTLCILGRRELLAEGPLAEWIKDVPEPTTEYTENWIFKDDLLARILLKDQIRKESKPILQKLREMKIRTVMLTGDRRGAAESVGREIGIEEVRSGMSPQDKVDAIRAFADEGYKVAMVGDGVNDAPSLAAAYVSVGMGARGSDAALEQSEVVLMKDRIDNFLAAIDLSVRARRVIRQNLMIALGTVVLMVGAATFGWIPLSVGVFMHEGSTVIVCLNSLRLLLSKGKSGIS